MPRILVFAALILTMALASCSEPTTDNVLYRKLAAIMDKQNEQWNAMDVKPSRGVNVTNAVCSIAPATDLEIMAEDESLSGNVTFKYYERSLAYADNTMLWTITRPIGWTEKQVLMIEISPTTGCFAVYRHTN
jgi:hypothetical protein